MCGIFGSNSKASFYELYLLNKTRGSYGSGIYGFKDNTSFLIYSDKDIKYNDIPEEMDYYLGHNRAPTDETKHFSADTSHPFFTERFVFAHNGIIKNTTKYEDTYNITYKVDSQWIGEFIERYSFADTFQKISNNPFAVWICTTTEDRKFYLARVANPIYYSKNDNSFSSTTFKDSKLLDEGKIYVGTADNIQWTLETFTYKSPYFIP